MKKFTLFAALTLCILLLAGCAEKPQKPSSNTHQPINGTQPEHTELDFLRSSIGEKDCVLGVGFLGYIDSESDEKAVREYVTGSTLAKAYPFLRDCDPVLLEGAELYAFVPANKDITVTVYRAELSEDGSYMDHKDSPLHTGESGEPVVLRCNLSEIYANVLISVTDGTNTLEFRPMISLKDGRVVQEQGCYDFSVYENDEDKSAEIAYERLAETDEVRNALQCGMKLLYTGDTQTIEGHPCLLFALGTDHEDQFVREQLYAVSDQLIYAYFPEADRWEPLAAE